MAKAKVDADVIQQQPKEEATKPVVEDSKTLEGALPVQADSVQVPPVSSEATATAVNADVVTTQNSGDLDLDDPVDNDDDVGGLDDIGTSTVEIDSMPGMDVYHYTPRAVGQTVFCGTTAVGPEGIKSHGEPNHSLEPYLEWLLERVIIPAVVKVIDDKL